MATITPGVPTSTAATTLYPSYQLFFDYNGNSYTMSLLLTNTGAGTSADLETTVSAMVAALGTGYSNIHLYEFAITETVVI